MSVQGNGEYQGPKMLSLELFNQAKGEPVDLEEHSELLQMPVDEAIERAFQIATGQPEYRMRPRPDHTVMMQPDQGYGRPATDLRKTLGDVLGSLAGTSVRARIGSESVQAGLGR